MGIGAVLEPLVVVTLLFGGTWINRNASYKLRMRARHRRTPSRATTEKSDIEDFPGTPNSVESDDPLLPGSLPASPSLLAVDQTAPWRERELRIWKFRTVLRTPNSRQFKDRWFSRVLRKFPFLQEAFYWALIYWVSDGRSCIHKLLAYYPALFLVLISLVGISNRSRIHSSYACFVHSRRRATSCAATHSH
jgi:hypothetical protein